MISSRWTVANGPVVTIRPPFDIRANVATLRSISGDGYQHADPPHPLGLLHARRERPRGCRRAAEERDELAPSHVRPPARRRTTPNVAWKIPHLSRCCRALK